MNASDLRESITIQKPADGSSGQYHSPEESETPWQKDFTDRAKVELDNQRSDVVAGKEEPKQRAMFKVRKRSEYEAADITQKRIVWNGDIYEIEAARPVDPRRQFYEISTIYSGETT